MTLYVPDFLSFEDNIMVIETVDFRGVTYTVAKNWKSKSKSSPEATSNDCS